MGGGGEGEGKERESGRWCKLLLLTLLACVDSVWGEGGRGKARRGKVADDVSYCY